MRCRGPRSRVNQTPEEAPCSYQNPSASCERKQLRTGALETVFRRRQSPPELRSPPRALGVLFPPVVMDLDPRHYEHVAVNDGDVRNIVLSYLVHNCFKETAETFLSCTGMNQPADYLADMEKRKSIYHFALEGNALKAIELTEQLAHNLLEENMDLHFDLLSLHFIDLVCAGNCTEALEFAQCKLTPFSKVHKYIGKLEDFMALLAYMEPEKSPLFHLLSPEYRQNVADSLNRAILAHANLPSYSSMERLIQQTTVVRQYLQEFVKVDNVNLL